MRFGSWLSIEDACQQAPAAPGVFQLRIVAGLLAFPRGRSAMVAYGAGPDLRAALNAFCEGPVYRRALGLGALLCRFGAPEPHDTAEATLAVLRRRFTDQFGAPPAAEEEA